jgi:hypothetical protein
MNNYCKLSFILEPVFPLQEILPQELADIGFESFEINDSGFNAFIRESEINIDNVHSREGERGERQGGGKEGSRQRR